MGKIKGFTKPEIYDAIIIPVPVVDSSKIGGCGKEIVSLMLLSICFSVHPVDHVYC